MMNYIQNETNKNSIRNSDENSISNIIPDALETNPKLPNQNNYHNVDQMNNSKHIQNFHQDQNQNPNLDNIPKKTRENPMNQTVSVNFDVGQDNEISINSRKEMMENKLIYSSFQNQDNKENQDKMDGQEKKSLYNNINKESSEYSSENNKEEQNTNQNSSSNSSTPTHSVRTQAKIVTPSRNNAVAKTLDRKQFFALMKGEQPKNRPRTMMRNRPISSSLPPSKVPEYADRAIEGKSLHITDPVAVSDIIDELIGRRIQALDENDYLKAHKIDEAMAKVRTGYRTNDRESLYNSTIHNLSQKKKMAEEDMQETKQQWKEKWKKFDQKQKEERDQQHERHIKEHEDLEEYWRDPSHYYEFNKRNPTQLQHIAIERSLAMTGRFEEAEQWRKMNEKNDKLIIKENYTRLQQKFDQQRQHLIELQEADAKRLQFQQDIERKLFAEDERQELEIKKLTIENTTRILEDEKQFKNFCAHTYKREPSVIVPPTCSTKGGNDIPPLPPGRIFPRGVEDKVRINAKPHTAPLPLPSLKIKKYKVPRYGEKSQKKEEEDDYD